MVTTNRVLIVSLNLQREGTVHVLLLLLFALQILLQHRQGLLQRLNGGRRHGAPAAFSAEFLQGALATHSSG